MRAGRRLTIEVSDDRRKQCKFPNPLTLTAKLTLTVETGTTVGTFSVNPVTFKGADNPNFLTSSFVPKAVGTALIKITSRKTLGCSNAGREITATVINP
jgi:hypothetical protein